MLKEALGIAALILALGGFIIGIITLIGSVKVTGFIALLIALYGLSLFIAVAVVSGNKER